MSFLANIFGAGDAQLKAMNERDYSPGGSIYERSRETNGEAGGSIVKFKSNIYAKTNTGNFFFGPLQLTVNAS